MKTIICTLSGCPALGDDVRICASARGGGRTDAPYIVAEADMNPDVLANVARGLSESFRKQFGSDMATARANGKMVVIACSALGDDWTIFFGTDGCNKGTLKMDVLDMMADELPQDASFAPKPVPPLFPGM
jgi:hypothetical protein